MRPDLRRTTRSGSRLDIFSSIFQQLDPLIRSLPSPLLLPLLFSPLLSSLRSCAQPRAPSARHYQASGPYCITDGPDRRERRQPACFLERGGGVQLSGGEEWVAEVAGEGRQGDLPPHPSRRKKIQSLFGGKGTLAQRDKANSPSKCAG